MRALVLLIAIAVGLVGCSASARSSPPPPPPMPTTRAFDGVQRLAVVAYGESRFTADMHSAEPGRTFDEILKFTDYSPYSATLRPILTLIHQGINWLLDLDTTKAASAHVSAVSPRTVVADALAQALQASGLFEQVRALEREPVGEERRRADAIVRIAVPSWGLVRVRQGDPALVSAFADVQGELTLRGTGAVLWQSQEDVTGAERLPLESLTGDPDFAREELMDVLARAGRRLASELLYSRSAGL